jgi:hypothetical protein
MPPRDIADMTHEDPHAGARSPEPTVPLDVEIESYINSLPRIGEGSEFGADSQKEHAVDALN